MLEQKRVKGDMGGRGREKSKVELSDLDDHGIVTCDDFAFRLRKIKE